MPPVFGPRSPSHSRLWSRAAGSATARASVADRDDARLAAARAAPRRRSARRRARAERLDRRRRLRRRCAATTTPLPAARPSALTTTPPPRSASSRAYAAASAGSSNDRRAGHRDAGRLGDLVAERLRRLDPRGCRRRAERRDAGRLERVGDAGRERRLRPDDDELDRSAAGRASTIGGRRRARRPRRAIRTRGSSRDPADPGATTISLTPGSAPSFQARACSRPPPPTTRIRVGITGRLIGRPRRRRQTGAAGRLRIGRQARSIVWVRSGPTETSTIGTPACASSAVT